MIFLFFLVFSFSILVSISPDRSVINEQIPDLKNERLFSLAENTSGMSYTIQYSESSDRNGLHQEYFQIDMPEGASQKKLKAIAQKIVKDAIDHKECHCIVIDFGIYGHVDFAPYGNWIKAGDIPLDNYKNYDFRYVFLR